MKSDIIVQLHENFENFAHQIDGEELIRIFNQKIQTSINRVGGEEA